MVFVFFSFRLSAFAVINPWKERCRKRRGMQRAGETMENRETMARQCQGLRPEQSRLRAAVEARYADGRNLEETEWRRSGRVTGGCEA